MLKSIFMNADDEIRNGWKILLFMLAAVVPHLLLGTLFRFVRLPGLAGPMAGFAAISGAMIAISACSLRLEGRSWHGFGLKLDRRWALEAVAGLGFGILILVLAALGLLSAGGFTWEFDPRGSVAGILAGFVLFLFAALYEELVYRGYPFQRLVDGIGAWPAMLVFATFFALSHLSNSGIHAADRALKLVTSINIALAAVLFGLAYLKTRSLALPVGLHLGWNWAQGNLLGFQVSGTGEAFSRSYLKPVLTSSLTWVTGGGVGLEGSVFCTMVLAVAIMAMLFWKSGLLSRR